MEYMLLELQGTVKINGETTLKGFSNCIEVLSYSHGLAQHVLATTSHTGRTVGRPDIQDMTISKTLDATSPLLNYNCAKAADLGTIKLHLVRQDATTETSGELGPAFAYMVYEMDKAVISSVSIGGGGGGLPMETLSFNFSKITWTYKPQKVGLGENGNIVGSWDQTTNTGSGEGEFTAEQGEAA
jgi:type VI secretion system secreted protein Hcp